MPTTVNIQRLFIGTGPLAVILFIVLVVSAIVIFVNRSKTEKKPKVKMNAPNEVDISYCRPRPITIKSRYIDMLEKLMHECDEGKISTRQAYIRLSEIFREFILEFDGEDVTKKTLSELKAEKKNDIASMIEEFYAVEFSYDAESDIIKAIERTIVAIDNRPSKR